MTKEAAALYFWTLVDQSGGPDACHPWTRKPMSTGYGQMNTAAFGLRTAHSLAYELTFGEIPIDPKMGRKLDVDHTCHNKDVTCTQAKTCRHRLCCNPKHLKLRTTGENRAAADEPRQRGKYAPTCPQGHPFTEENLGQTKRRKRGEEYVEKYCKACNREKAYKAKHGSERPADALESLSRAGTPVCRRGHAYDEQNTKYDSTTGKRRCRKCERLNDINAKRRKKGLEPLSRLPE